jgi:hypothetical protein
MRVARGADVNYVDISSYYDILPNSRKFFPAKSFRYFPYFTFVSSTDNFQDWLKRNVEKTADLTPGIAMCPAHEAVTY